MTTIELTFNEKNTLASKALEYILSLGFFKVNKKSSPASRKTMKALKELEEGNVTECNTWEDFLEAVK